MTTFEYFMHFLMAASSRKLYGYINKHKIFKYHITHLPWFKRGHCNNVLAIFAANCIFHFSLLSFMLQKHM